jgi:hypothetical protein
MNDSDWATAAVRALIDKVRTACLVEYLRRAQELRAGQ